jgi:DNA-binding transcriptional regulator YhcF (GntR family)
LRWQFNNQRPIYAQLIEQIQFGVVTGEYPKGSNLPSVRALALEAEVNPNTMQKALSELETQGLLYTRRTAGRFVTEDEEVVRKLREQLAEKTIRAFFQGMERLGISQEEAAGMLETAKEGK